MKNRKFAWLLSLTMGVLVTSCGDDDSSNPAGPGQASDFETVQSSVDAYTGGDKAPVITAQALFDNLNDGDASNDPLIVSVRSPEHYAAGHIPGAINIPWREIGTSAKLATLPTDREIVVYCYTGHTGGVATTALNAMGFNAVNMKYGMVGWTQDATVRATQPFNDAVDAHDFPIEMSINNPGQYNLADPVYVAVDGDVVQGAVDGYVSSKAPVITAQAVFDNLNDGDASNDPLIVSVRSSDHYAMGHIPGAINIPWRDIAKSENLAKLPTDRQIVVYCYTGHTGAVATTALNMLGYDAINMKFGMGAWTRDASVRASTPFSEDAANNFAVVAGM
jgi:sulfur-carrier protein adenylyltransferase/sulfurtransferase